MPPFADWLRASWEDFRRRWGRLMTVIGVAGVATCVAALVPVLPAAVLSVLHLGSPWLVWAAAGLASLCAALWLSTWGQAAAVRVARFDEGAGESLSRAWAQTASFGWVITLTFLATAGGFALFVLPGVVLFVLLFFAPYYELSGEGAGMRSIGLSWARVAARPFDAALRLLAAFVISWAPSRIPYVGWLIAMFWAPFFLIASSRLADDLRAAAPEAAPPPWLPGLVAGLTLALVAGLGAATAGSLVLARRSLPLMAGMMTRAMSGGLDPDTGNALIAVLQHNATPEQQQKAYAFVMAGSSGTVSALPEGP